MKFAVIILILIMASVQVIADTPNASSLSDNMSIELRETPLKEALATILYDTGVTFEMDGASLRLVVPELVVKSVPASVVIKTLGKSLGFTATLSGNHYTITCVESKDETPEQQTAPKYQVSVGSTRYEVQEAMGKPTRIVPGVVNGNELWIYPGDEILFVGCRVASISDIRDKPIAGKFTGGPPKPIFDPKITLHAKNAPNAKYGSGSGNQVTYIMRPQVRFTTPEEYGRDILLAGMGGNPNLVGVMVTPQ